MDPFTISTGVAGFLSLALEIGKILLEYTSQVNSAPQDAQILLTEITALGHVLEQLIKFLRKEDIKANFQETSVLCSVIRICEGKIKTLHSRLTKFQSSGGFKDRFRWPLHKQDCIDTASTLHHCAQIIEFSLTIGNCELLSKTSQEVKATLSDQKKHIDSILLLFKDVPPEMARMGATLNKVLSFVSEIDTLAIHIQDIKSGVQSLQQNIDAEYTERLLAWLSPLEPQKRHQDVKATRVENTGNWILWSDHFQSWVKGETGSQNEVLGYYGEPGAGKTVLASIIVDYLTSIPNGPGTSIAYLYCDYRDQKEQCLVHILGSFVKQLVWNSIFTGMQLPELVHHSFKSAVGLRASLELDKAKVMLKHLLQQHNHAFILIDALDELQNQTRIELLKVMQEILHLRALALSSESQFKDRSSLVHLCFTARPHIQDQVKFHLGVAVRTLRIEAQHDDIQKYLMHRIDNDPCQDAMNNALKEEMLETLPKMSEGMFLLPALHIGMILDKLTVSKRRCALRNLPSGLYAAYDGTIARIQESQSRGEIGMKALMWTYLAERPLKVIELRHALSVEDEDETLDCENIPSENTVIECCCGLLTVDEETSTARLVHYTLQEYFKSRHEQHFPAGHSGVARICLTYLRLTTSSTTVADPVFGKLREDYPLFEYARRQWGHHARKQCDETLHALAIALFEREDPLQALHSLRCSLHTPHAFCTLPSLHVVAHFGVESIFQTLLRASDPNAKSTCGNTALMYAAHRGQEVIVRLLLDRADVDVNMRMPNKWKSTPLLKAAAGGHEAIVRLLLEQANVNINIQDRWGSTPLSEAAMNGHEAVVRLLLERADVNVNMQDKNGITPLLKAVARSDNAIVRLLLDRADVDVNMQDKKGQTPLFKAVSHGPEAIVRLLLERADIDINIQDDVGSTPLLHAAAYGREAVVSLLLKRADVDVNMQDESGSTPLLQAAIYGREAAVRLLLERADVNINIQDELGSAPLLKAAASGHEAVVRLLLAREDININIQDQSGSTPLLQAAAHGREAVVRLLLERTNVNVNLANRIGRTPLSLAIEKGHSMIAQLLLDRGAQSTAQPTSSLCPKRKFSAIED